MMYALGQLITETFIVENLYVELQAELEWGCRTKAKGARGKRLALEPSSLAQLAGEGWRELFAHWPTSSQSLTDTWNRVLPFPLRLRQNSHFPDNTESVKPFFGKVSK